MNNSEARLRIHTLITEAMFEMVDGPDLNEADRDELREDMANAADIVMEVLDIRVKSVEGNHAEATIRLQEN